MRSSEQQEARVARWLNAQKLSARPAWQKLSLKARREGLFSKNYSASANTLARVWKKVQTRQKETV